MNYLDRYAWSDGKLVLLTAAISAAGATVLVVSLGILAVRRIKKPK